MRVPTHDPRWKDDKDVIAQFADRVSAAATNLNALLRRAALIQSEIERQMGGSMSGMAKLMRPMRALEEACDKADQAAVAFQDFVETYRKL